jgi:serine/threonine protein kinase
VPLDAKYLVVRRLCETIAYLHSNRIAHHDISLETIGISDSGSPVISEPSMAIINDAGTSLSTLAATERWWALRIGMYLTC